MALEVYNLPTNTPNDEILYGIKDRGIYYWNENIKLIDSFKDLDLPLEIRARNILLKEYCELRIKSYELLYKAISEDTDQYKSQIVDYEKKINAIINELGGEQQKQ
jgi:rhomboid protease GluP